MQEEGGGGQETGQGREGGRGEEEGRTGLARWRAREKVSCLPTPRLSCATSLPPLPLPVSFCMLSLSSLSLHALPCAPWLIAASLNRQDARSLSPRGGGGKQVGLPFYSCEKGEKQ